MKQSIATLHWNDDYTTSIASRSHSLVADEPVDLGGKDTAATPMELLMSGLASCTAITIKMYAQRKEWKFETIEVTVKKQEAESEIQFKKSIKITGHQFSDEQIRRLLIISEKCPVNKLINSGAKTSTELLK
jgi:putative redox protein